MLSFARLVNLAGYVVLALGLTLANARLVLELDPSRHLQLGRAGFYLAAFSAVLFVLGLVALSVAWLGRWMPAAKSADVSV